MGSFRRRARKSLRKELTIEKIEEDKEKERQKAYNPRHSTGDITIGPAPPIQIERRNSMGSIMDTPLSTSIPKFSTNLTSNDASNPSSSTHRVESQLHSNLLEEAGYEKGDYSEFIEGFPNIVDDAFQQMNNVVQSPTQNLNVTPSIS